MNTRYVALRHSKPYCLYGDPTWFPAWLPRWLSTTSNLYPYGSDEKQRSKGCGSVRIDKYILMRSTSKRLALHIIAA